MPAMPEFKKILFPTDFSQCAAGALPHALELAKRYDAHLFVAHVRTLFADDPHNPEHRFLDEKALAAEVQNNLDSVARSARSHPRVETILLRSASAPPAILEYAAEGGIDLVVMGTHGRSAVAHFFLGSVAERVVRHAPCPVLTVAEGRDGYRSEPSYSRILAAYDFSGHSLEAVGWAAGLAGKFGAELHLAHVVEQPVHPAYYDLWNRAVKQQIPTIAEEARRSIDRLLDELTFSGPVEVEVVVDEPKVHRGLERIARERQVDLMVLGTHGLSGVERVLMGSTTERLVRTAPCPVLAVKRTAA